MELSTIIEQHKDQYGIQTLCDVLEIPRSTYYDSFQKVESNRDCENKEITQRIIEIHTESKQRYRAPKIHKILQKESYKVSLKRT
ncbi:IS3 family transposase [Heyndrickxia ginsengihumi]|uniref:IS3 family transposase n=1 Tax=Heyndrickxia ginsengihumi TaxID=363870 RepID=UPI003D1A4713